MEENELSGIIIGVMIKIHRSLGPGLYESIYEDIICHELKKLNLPYERQKKINVFYDIRQFNFGFRADLIIDNRIIVEIKSIESIAHIHYKQLQTYLKLTNIRIGLLVNFNEVLLKDGIHRVING